MISVSLAVGVPVKLIIAEPARTVPIDSESSGFVPPISCAVQIGATRNDVGKFTVRLGFALGVVPTVMVNDSRCELPDAALTLGEVPHPEVSATFAVVCVVPVMD